MLHVASPIKSELLSELKLLCKVSLRSLPRTLFSFLVVFVMKDLPDYVLLFSSALIMESNSFDSES